MPEKRESYEDYTDKLGPLYEGEASHREWPMYAYRRPAYLFWNGVANGLRDKGYTEEQARDWLQSKNARYSLDGGWETEIEDLGYRLARGGKGAC